MNRVYFHVPTTPIPWARARTRGSVHFTPKKQRAERDNVQLHARRAMGNKPPMNGPLRLAARFVYPYPKSWSEKRRRLPESRWKTSKPDSDNLLKLLKDALNGVVYIDDAQVTHTECLKLHGNMPGTFVSIEQLVPEYDEDQPCKDTGPQKKMNPSPECGATESPHPLLEKS
jgi:Holliday junction resolvase RusA-like endonuclease